MNVEMTLNGEQRRAVAEPTTSLLDWLRSEGLTGTKEGCGIGVCGVCTVLLDDLPVSACLTLVPMAAGRDVLTVEGIARDEPALIDAFVTCEGMQCGICTPGQIMAAAAARRAGIATEPDADVESEIRTWLSGNLCRCTGYETIVAAVRTYLGR